MGTSTLVKEDDEFIYLTKYMHDEPDEWPEWAYKDGERKAYPEHVVEADNYATYEIRVDYKINKQTGKVEFIGIR